MLDRLKIYSDKKAADIITNKETIPPLLIIIRKALLAFLNVISAEKDIGKVNGGF